MRVLMLCLMVCGIVVRPAAAQPAPPSPASAAGTTPDAVVRLWIDRWNALSEGPETLDAFVAL